MNLAYSGLHQLCAPLLDHLDRLPRPQRDALAVVFGLSSRGRHPDRFLVALATLTLGDQVAEDEPLACVVDDAQWLDQASARVLAFVGRRLLAEPVALVCAARTGTGAAVLAGLPELPVGGLGGDDARSLMGGNVTGPIDTEVVDQIVVESHGNPLALLELPHTWTSLRTGRRLRPSGQRAGVQQGRAELRPAARFPCRTGDPAAAVDRGCRAARRSAPAGGEPPLCWAWTWPRPSRRWLPACSVWAATWFRAPLGPFGRHQAASASDQRRAMTRWPRPPTRARPGPPGLAPGPSGRRARRGRRERTRTIGRTSPGPRWVAAAAAFLTRATELTPLPAARTRRALAAASANVQAGAFDTAGACSLSPVPAPVDELQRAQADLISAQLAFASSRGVRPPCCSWPRRSASGRSISGSPARPTWMPSPRRSSRPG